MRGFVPRCQHLMNWFARLRQVRMMQICRLVPECQLQEYQL